VVRIGGGVGVKTVEGLGPLGEMKDKPVQEMATRCDAIDGCVDLMDHIGRLDAGKNEPVVKTEI
jgi:hypothetical protein